MSQQRVIKYAVIHNARIVGMRNLWEPITTFEGRPVQVPTYLASFIVPKTRAAWHEEPIFANLIQAFNELYQEVMAPAGYQMNQVEWPVRDGDVDLPGKRSFDWQRGHWSFNGNSQFPINVEIVQGGVPVKLKNRTTVKPGDYVACNVGATRNARDKHAVKLYVNSVLFLNPGEEIVIGNYVPGSELMAQAKAAGLNVTGFGAPVPNAGSGGFGAPPFVAPNLSSGFGKPPF